MHNEIELFGIYNKTFSTSSKVVYKYISVVFFVIVIVVSVRFIYLYQFDLQPA